MRISTSTNIHQLWRDDSIYSTADSIRLIKAMGFEAVDISMNTVSLPEGPLAGLGWMEWVDDVAEALDETGLPATQSHAIFKSQKLATLNNVDTYIKKMLDRNINICGKLGIPEITLHPLHGIDVYGLSHKEMMQKNVAWFKQFEEIADYHNVGICIENMFPREFATASDLLELLYLLDNDRIFGICWDTGHANITGQNQVDSIHMMEGHLRSMHIADNRGKDDQHLLPGLGNINWNGLVAALLEIGYAGDFTYEIQEMTRFMPVELHNDFLRFAVKTANVFLGK